ncbi:hypothetical protein K461DRAFT_259621 [Myriangium duriaei CBS 260.36]|uniref:Uncharacterized protein n=1 Tax=Myriangium duriaei CBS 260.36 TaxID=1168546 RepID=A0A9P4IXR4_9PEZI|nr:hypothetical protein K461DRAFT_259621 [Myriangium duriaei CBS 260.36]
MPDLEDLEYSRDQCVEAIRDFYRFLTHMYVDEADVKEPPSGGWSSVTPENVEAMGKSEEVGDLLRHLPYIAIPDNTYDDFAVLPRCFFANWPLRFALAESSEAPGWSFPGLREMSDPPYCSKHVPSHIVGLTLGSQDDQTIMLDTQYGIVYWYYPPDEIRDNNPVEEVRSEEYPDWYDSEDEETEEEGGEAQWFMQCMTWTVPDFFELLKIKIRELEYIPLTYQKVFHKGKPEDDPECIDPISKAENIYREHGWPDQDRYRKQECMVTIRSMPEEDEARSTH